MLAVAAAGLLALGCPDAPRVVGAHGRTALVVCHRGRRVVVDRARLPRAITAGSVAGGRVAWAVARRGRSVVRLARVAGTRRVLLRRTVRGWVTGVALTSRGELAWMTRRRLTMAGLGTLATGELSGLGVEDDRTLRWRDAHELVYRDLRPWPAGECPRRERFHRRLSSPEILVTEAVYGGEDHTLTATRACVRATGADPVVLQGGYSWGFAEARDVVALAGTWLVTRQDTVSRYHGCEWAVIEPLDAATGARGRAAEIKDCDPALVPGKRARYAVTERGVPAWTVRDCLLTAGPDLKPLELDRGAIAGLRADGPRVVWTRDGVERSAEP